MYLLIQLCNLKVNDSQKIAIYDPAKGVPKIPTASSAQIRNANSKTVPPIMNLNFKFLTFLRMSSINIPVPNKRTPIIEKSRRLQLTSSVNCMAIRGTDRSSDANTRRISNLLFIVSSFYEFISALTDNCK
jgi:hypothetical protein